MEKQKTTFMSNVVSILGSQILIKLLGLVYQLVLINIPGFGDLGNGYRTAGFQIYTMLLAISSVGIPNAISKMVSERLAVGDRKGANAVFRAAMVLFAGIGLVFTLLLYWGADFVALTIIRMDGVQLTLKALSPSIFFVCVSAVIRGYFLGQQNVRPNNRSQMLEQVFKATLTILFVMLLTHYSAAIMAAGANAATSVSTALSFFYLLIVFLMYRHREGMESQPMSLRQMRKLTKTILCLSIPISLSSIITTVARVIDTATISRGIASAFAAGIPGATGVPTNADLMAKAAQLSGMLSKSDNITNLPLAINIAFATVLVPTISAALAVGDRKKASQKISYSLLISTLIILPCAMGLIILAEPFFRLMYPNAADGASLLQIASVALIFTALDQTICGSLQGLGRVMVPATGLLCGAAVKLVLNLILIRIPSVNIYGAAISSVVCHVIAFSICFASLRRAIPLKLRRTKYLTKPILATAFMSLVTWGSYRLSMLVLHSNAISCLLSVALSVAAYGFAVIQLHILSKKELLELPMGARIVKALHMN